MEIKKLRKDHGLRHEPIRTGNRTAAINLVAHGVKPHRVMLGFDGMFWVVCPADAAKLAEMGCEYAD